MKIQAAVKSCLYLQAEWVEVKCPLKDVDTPKGRNYFAKIHDC